MLCLFPPSLCLSFGYESGCSFRSVPSILIAAPRIFGGDLSSLRGVPLALFYVAFGMPIAWLADRSNRRNIVAASLVIWSGFTVLCGMSLTYWQFLFRRIGVGIGEAGATPPSNSIVSDYFPAARRPMAMSIFALGAPIGAWLGADWAGAVAQEYGWRAAFYALGIPGLVLSYYAAVTYVPEARRALRDGRAEREGRHP